MKKSLLVLFLMNCLSVVVAHEFWLSPSHYRAQAGQQIALTFLVGENFQGEKWEKRKERTQSVQLIGASSTLDLTAIAKKDTNDIPLLLEKEGTYLVSMRSNNSFIELEAQKFNEYLKEDGIENISLFSSIKF
jgi:uncharacterized GH25 family protein